MIRILKTGVRFRAAGDHACHATSHRILITRITASIGFILLCHAALARTGPQFYERRIVPMSGRHYCIAKHAAMDGPGSKVTVTIYHRQQDMAMPSPAAKRWPLEALWRDLPIDRDISPSKIDTVVRAVTVDYPPRDIRVSAAGCGIALISTPDIYAPRDLFKHYPFVIVIPMRGSRTHEIMLDTLFTPHEIVGRTDSDGVFKYYFDSWFDEKRHRLILADLQERPPETIVVVDLVEGKARRGHVSDIVESLDNKTIDSLYGAIRNAESVPGVEVDNILVNMIHDMNHSVGVRALAASTLHRRGNPAGENFLQCLCEQRSTEIRNDPRTKQWMDGMPVLAAEIGFTPVVDRWLALSLSVPRKSSVRDDR